MKSFKGIDEKMDGSMLSDMVSERWNNFFYLL